MRNVNLEYKIKMMILKIKSKSRDIRWRDVMTTITAIAAIATIFSMYLVYATLKEMQTERDSAYRPDIMIETKQVDISWGNIETFDKNLKPNE